MGLPNRLLLIGFIGQRDCCCWPVKFGVDRRPSAVAAAAPLGRVASRMDAGGRESISQSAVSLRLSIGRPTDRPTGRPASGSSCQGELDRSVGQLENPAKRQNFELIWHVSRQLQLRNQPKRAGEPRELRSVFRQCAAALTLKV